MLLNFFVLNIIEIPLLNEIEYIDYKFYKNNEFCNAWIININLFIR